MKKFYNKIKINNYTYLFLILCAICGYLKNISIIFLICIIHELGHVFFSLIFKEEIVSIEILPFGGLTTTNKKINSNINKDILINLGGIIFQLIFISILFLFKAKLNLITFNLFINYNFILIIFNLLPIISLDGNNIMHLLIEKYFSYRISYQINFLLSTISLIIFLLINYIYSLDNYFIISFLFYKSIMYIKNYKYLHNKFLLERTLYDIKYNKIESNTKHINDLKKETLHYFKENNHYINEKTKLERFFSKFDK